MENYSNLLKQIEISGQELFWFGPVTDSQIELLEKKLDVELSVSFKQFLKKYGGGGVIDDDILGIVDNNASLNSGGTVFGATIELREEFQMPKYLVAIVYQDQEISWCIDTSKMNEEGECPVVSYDLFSRKVTNKITNNFELFFKEYLELRAEV